MQTRAVALLLHSSSSSSSSGTRHQQNRRARALSGAGPNGRMACSRCVMSIDGRREAATRRRLCSASFCVRCGARARRRCTRCARCTRAAAPDALNLSFSAHHTPPHDTAEGAPAWQRAVVRPRGRHRRQGVRGREREALWPGGARRRQNAAQTAASNTTSLTRTPFPPPPPSHIPWCRRRARRNSASGSRRSSRRRARRRSSRGRRACLSAFT